MYSASVQGCRAGGVNCIIPPLLLFMLVINSNRRCGDSTELYVNKIQEAPLHTLTPDQQTQQETNSRRQKVWYVHLLDIMKVFQVRVSLIITRKIYSIIVLSNVPVLLITLRLTWLPTWTKSCTPEHSAVSSASLLYTWSYYD